VEAEMPLAHGGCEDGGSTSRGDQGAFQSIVAGRKSKVSGGKSRGAGRKWQVSSRRPKGESQADFPGALQRRYFAS
jgi:hypothetical protein